MTEKVKGELDALRGLLAAVNDTWRSYTPANSSGFDDRFREVLRHRELCNSLAGEAAAPTPESPGDEEPLDIVFAGPPGRPWGPRFVECERGGKSVKVGEWIHRDDGHWVLRLDYPPPTPSPVREALARFAQQHCDCGATDPEAECVVCKMYRAALSSLDEPEEDPETRLHWVSGDAHEALQAALAEKDARIEHIKSEFALLADAHQGLAQADDAKALRIEELEENLRARSRQVQELETENKDLMRKPEVAALITELVRLYKVGLLGGSLRRLTEPFLPSKKTRLERLEEEHRAVASVIRSLDGSIYSGYKAVASSHRAVEEAGEGE